MQHIFTMRRVMRLVVLAFIAISIILTYAYATGVSARVTTLEHAAHAHPGHVQGTYASRVDVEALWADHDALVLCIANTAYTRPLILQCLEDVASAARHDPTCQEDEPCWDCSSMGNKVCGRNP